MTWGDVFWRWVLKGHDRSSAAYEADKWEARKRRAALSAAAEPSHSGEGQGDGE